MKLLRTAISVVALVLLGTLLADAQATPGYMRNSTGVVSTSGTITDLDNLYATINNTFEVVMTGAPSTVSVVTKGCMRGGTCDVLDTYTTVADAIRNPTITKTYDFFRVTVSWTGGTSPTVRVNRTGTIAKSGGSGVSAYTDIVALFGSGSCSGFLKSDGACYALTPPGDFSASNLTLTRTAETVTFSATPTFACKSLEQITLTGNITSSTLSGCTTDGQRIRMKFIQDATGGRTVVCPVNMLGCAQPDLTANRVSYQIFEWDNATSKAVAVSPMMTDTGAGIFLDYVKSAASGASNFSSISDPGAPATGDFWFNTTLFKFYDGTAIRTVATRDLAETLTNKILTTPTIASFVNAGHTHADAANGGQISMTAFASGNRTGASSSKAVTAVAAGTSGNCAQWAASGELGEGSAACGSGSGGVAGATLFSSTTNAGPSNTATETSVIGTVTGSKTIAANTFVDGGVLQTFAEGRFSIPAVADSLTIKYYCGATVLATGSATFAAGALTNGTWTAHPVITSRGTGGSGTLMMNGLLEFSGSGLAPTEIKLGAGDGTAPNTAVSFDFTTSCAFELKAKWGAAQSGELIEATNVSAWIPGAAVSSVNGLTGAVKVARVLSMQTTSTDVSTTAGPDTIYSFTLTGGTLGANDCLTMYVNSGRGSTGTTGGQTWGVKLGSATAANWAQHTSTTATTHLNFVAHICNNGATNSQVVMLETSLESNATVRTGNPNITTSWAVDTTADQTFTFQGTNAVGTGNTFSRAGFLAVKN